MIDGVQQNFVRGFIDYLKNQIDSQTFTADAQESCEVAIQCLQAAFDLGEEIEEQTQTSSSDGSAAATTSKEDKPKQLDLFEMYETHYSENNPDYVRIANEIKSDGNRLMKDGKYSEALLKYNRAIMYYPTNPIIYCNRAAAHLRLGNNQAAITDCKTALIYCPEYGKAYGRLGIAYSNIGKYEESQQAYAKAIELEPDNLDYRNNLEVSRNARSNAQAGFVNQLTEGLNAMISNPVIRNLFTSAEIDLQSLQSMTQNPAVLNAVGQLFTGGQDGAGGVAIGPNEMLQLFQNLSQQLSSASAATNQTQNPENASPNNDQQPPST